LAVLYLVARIESEVSTTGEDAELVYCYFERGFRQKASPIFNDPFNFNSVFNDFLTQTCDF
jgi:hypothetical protein